MSSGIESSRTAAGDVTERAAPASPAATDPPGAIGLDHGVGPAPSEPASTDGHRGKPAQLTGRTNRAGRSSRGSGTAWIRGPAFARRRPPHAPETLASCRPDPDTAFHG
jgi:hypothetical protein